jgi:hypothetical protein
VIRCTIKVVGIVALLILANIPAYSEEKPKTYQTGKLLDVSVQDVSRGTVVLGGSAIPIAVPIPGQLYIFQIQLGDLIYFAKYEAGKRSYKPVWIVNDSIELRLDKDEMYLKRPDQKELKVTIVKKVRAAKGND